MERDSQDEQHQAEAVRWLPAASTWEEEEELVCTWDVEQCRRDVEPQTPATLIVLSSHLLYQLKVIIGLPQSQVWITAAAIG